MRQNQEIADPTFAYRYSVHGSVPAMLDADDFESAFRSADKRQFHLRRPVIDHVVVLTDLSGDELPRFADAVRTFLTVLGEVKWTVLGDADHRNVSHAVERIEALQPDLVCTYRNVKTEAWKWPFSLGAYVNVLTRTTDVPILVLPHPREVPSITWQTSDTDSVLVATDHLAGDDALVNWGARLTRNVGVLHLAHIEDEVALNRYLDAISKIEGINTEFAEHAIVEQLLKEPLEYTETCRRELAATRHGFSVEGRIRRGCGLNDYKQLIEGDNVDLLIVRTTENGQLAMHGASYLLAVELRSTPLLMV